MTLYPIASVGLAMVALVLIKTGRDALFLSTQTLDTLSLAFILIAAASVPAAMAHVAAILRFGLRPARVAVLIFSGFLFLIWAPFLNQRSPWISGALFVVVPVVFAALFATLWLLASDLIDESDETSRRWVYSRIGAGSLAGGTLGGLLAKAMAPKLDPSWLVALGGCLVLGVGLSVLIVHRKHPCPVGSGRSVNQTAVAPEVLTPWLGLFRLPFVNGLVAVSSLAAIAGLLIEFQFYSQVKLAGQANTNFFATFYTLLNAVALIFQLGVTPLLQSRLGVTGSLLVMPLGLLTGTLFTGLSGTLFAGPALKVAENGLKSAVHRSTWEQAFLFLDRKVRGIAKALVDGLAARIAEGVAAAGLLLWMWAGSGPATQPGLFYTVLSMVLLLWLGFTFRLIGLGCGTSRDRDYMIRLPDA